MNPDIETTLRDDLHRIVADQPFAPDVDVAERRGRALRRRGTAVRGVAVLAVVAGVTAAGLAIANRPGAAPTQRIATAPIPAAPAPAASAQVILARTVAAVSAQDAVLRVSVHTADVDQHNTVDSSDQASEMNYTTPAGQPVWTLAIHQTSPGRFEARMIDYRKQVWFDTPMTGFTGVQNPGTEIIDQLKKDQTTKENGCVKVVSTAVVDGQLADQLALLDTNCQNSSGSMWISRATSLPIKSDSPGATVAYQWSGPGSVNPATLWPTVPAGFQQIPPTPTFDKP